MWSYDGIICTGETYKNKVKTTFAKPAYISSDAPVTAARCVLRQRGGRSASTTRFTRRLSAALDRQAPAAVNACRQ